jgi:hypothetical protein
LSESVSQNFSLELRSVFEETAGSQSLSSAPQPATSACRFDFLSSQIRRIKEDKSPLGRVVMLPATSVAVTLILQPYLSLFFILSLFMCLFLNLHFFFNRDL